MNIIKPSKEQSKGPFCW